MEIETAREQEESIIDSLSIKAQIYMMISGVILLAGTFSMQDIQRENQRIDEHLATMQELTERAVSKTLENKSLEDNLDNKQEKPPATSFIALAKIYQ